MNPVQPAAQLDRRVHRTRVTITDSLLSLILEKDFQNIIIKDITEKANINRSTFYAHYKDKYHLLDTLIQEKLVLLSRISDNYTLQSATDMPDSDTPDPYFTALFQHIAEHELFYRIMLVNKPSPDFASNMLEVLRDNLFARIAHINREKKPIVSLDLLLDYFTASHMGLIEKWLKQDMIYTHRHMALQLTRLSAAGLYRGIGLAT